MGDAQWDNEYRKAGEMKDKIEQVCKKYSFVEPDIMRNGHARSWELEPELEAVLKKAKQVEEKRDAIRNEIKRLAGIFNTDYPVIVDAAEVRENELTKVLKDLIARVSLVTVTPRQPSCFIVHMHEFTKFLDQLSGDNSMSLTMERYPTLSGTTIPMIAINITEDMDRVQAVAKIGSILKSMFFIDNMYDLNTLLLDAKQKSLLLDISELKAWTQYHIGFPVERAIVDTTDSDNPIIYLYAG